MRIHEITESQLDEISTQDLKRGAQIAALGLGMGAGALGLNKPAPTPAPAPVATQAVQQQVQAEPEKMPASIPLKPPGPSTSVKADTEGMGKLAKYAKSQGIKGVELAALLAQSATETSGFTRLVEKGDKAYFSQYDGKLGNDRPGDGYKYRGRGYLHITGKWMYAKCGRALGLDLVKHPELLERPDIALKASIWFWKDRVAPFVKDFSDVISVTQRVNGGMGALGDRAGNFDDYRRRLNV